MTDNEVIKSLQECSTNDYNGETGRCYRCSYLDDCFETEGCMTKLISDALFLINRQRAEIEKIEAKLSSHVEENAFLRRYIGIHEESYLSQIVANYNGILATTKSEAIKEFADKLKCDITVENTDDGYLDETIDYYSLMTIIDDLVKEMVGDS